MKPVVQLIEEWTAFEDANSEHSVEAFCRYYLQKQRPKPKHTNEHIMNGVTLLKTIGRILKAYSVYFRSAVHYNDMPPSEGFYYLHSLSQLGEVKKSDLINDMFAETTTGMEIINKLIREKKITERTSPDDKRAKLIKITEKGTVILHEYYKISTKAVEMMFKDLSDEILVDCNEMLEHCAQRNLSLAVELKNKPFPQMYERVMEQ
ncbi:Winged helix DNA-binding domain-containing protein [Mucilaginibacter lappiensis]|uniref:DNA-binding MarR family transcriptional regulator n=1 Tax=Mucilaginibacter lappiensis TaxID=354630 RepID=A0ABR6PPM1_9SPHI|nr:MarR family winged helix-turn-helix transcriptional regulator [Mucilaginibacter lappiensis]MBB6111149.1 DNA-binding MarR family transcriptional regulator [Mucilaginibacter lappiensis]SIR70306.1 Winged helix DNA-binding domain-containing protein [Mucilaginibacter lappiensis]